MIPMLLSMRDQSVDAGVLEQPRRLLMACGDGTRAHLVVCRGILMN